HTTSAVSGSMWSPTSFRKASRYSRLTMTVCTSFAVCDRSVIGFFSFVTVVLPFTVAKTFFVTVAAKFQAARLQLVFSTQPLARAVLDHARDIVGRSGEVCCHLRRSRARVTDEKERHLPRPPHLFRFSVPFWCSVSGPYAFIGRSTGRAPFATALPLTSGATLGSLRAWCVAPV